MGGSDFCGVGRRRGSAFFPLFFFALQQRVVLKKTLQLLIQLEGGQLKQTDGLLQLRRERQVLRELELQ